MELGVKTLKQVKLTKLIKLGYDKPEAKFITNLSKLILIEVENKNITKQEDFSKYHVIADGHTAGTNLYTRTIVKSIIKHDYKNWSNYSIHLNYGTIFRYFYVCGCTDLGNKLMFYNFQKPNEYDALKNFRNKNEKDITAHDLLPLLKIVEGSHL